MQTISNITKGIGVLTISIASLACLNKPTNEISLGQRPKIVELSGNKGGLVSGGVWSSQSLKDKLKLLIYVDPDESSLNDDFTAALKKENFSEKDFGSVAIINLAATWKPNAIIESILESKQKEFPNTTYVTDKDKYLVKEWELKDDSFDAVLFDRDSQVIFRAHGKIDSKTTIEIIDTIKNEIKNPGSTATKINKEKSNQRC